jgi:hypothetical protein
MPGGFRRDDLTPPGLTGRRLRPHFASGDVSGRRAPNVPHEGSGPATAKRLPAPAANPVASVPPAPPAPPYHDLRLFDAAGLPPVRAHGGDRRRVCWLRNQKLAGTDAGQSAQQGAEEAAAVEYGHRLLLVVCQQRSVRGHHGMATTGAIREQPVLPCTCVRTLNVADVQPAFFHTRAPRRAPHLEHSLNDAHGRLCKACMPRGSADREGRTTPTAVAHTKSPWDFRHGGLGRPGAPAGRPRLPLLGEPAGCVGFTTDTVVVLAPRNRD